jgi:hypothetical protein
MVRGFAVNFNKELIWPCGGGCGVGGQREVKMVVVVVGKSVSMFGYAFF